MVAHLGHDKHEAVANPAGNARIGSSRKTLKGEFGELLIEILRDWQGSFEKHQIRWTGSRAIFSAAKVEEAEQHFAAFGDKWDRDYPVIGQSRRRNWARITPFLDYPSEIRWVIYTTNAIESMNTSLRKIAKNRGSFPTDEALPILFYLAIQNISRKWTMPILAWKAALNRFTIQFEERMPQH